MTKPLCVIPARLGSKRLPRKNLLPLCGKPMLTYTVEAALRCGLFDRVYVSTEAQELAVIAEQAGAVAHQRPPELAGDLVSATDVCLELHEVLASAGQEFSAIVCLQPSSPLRLDIDIIRSWECFVRSGATYLVSTTPVDPHYFHWALHEDENGWRMYFGQQFMKERPLLPPVYRPNGAVKIGKPGPLAELKNFFGEPLATCDMPEERSIHVATDFDFQLAEFLLSRHALEHAERPNGSGLGSIGAAHTGILRPAR